ncbi:probable G-protein coupled receptor Mth-like 3 isoform X2 [Leptidea sinapis]|uniref:probable G-protein coupled receptor Mth-like 3 isoform X2 n=1 Tax=Leptidea sinapis TaxID=189913 RepID=UPI002123EB3C|nr:probable G-protein coupled receptor Mth-like 3 isoform X2 [Leptidea sinapis]
MRFFILFYVLFNSTFGDISETNVFDAMVFRKCCSRNQSIIKVTEYDLSLVERYECVDRDYLFESYNISVTSLLVDKRVEVQHGLPADCDDLQMVQINGPDAELFLWENECYDRLVTEINNGSLKHNIPKTIALSCNKTRDKTNETKSSFKIEQVRKCCPKGQEFDTDHHVCRNSVEEVDEETFLRKFNISGPYIYETEYTLRCKFDEYVVELTEDIFSLQVSNSDLITMNRYNGNVKTLIQGEWCVDQQYDGTQLLAQVCTRNCDDFGAFCVRKCCPPGHHFKLRRCGGLSSVCVRDEDEFVQFNISTYLAPLADEFGDLPDVMGIRYALQCPAGRFALNKSLPQDVHEMTAQGAIKTPLTVTFDYCVEMFDRRDCPTNDVYLSGVLCFQPSEKTKNYRFSFVIITISAVCLGLTLIIYIIFPELRNLHGRNLVCHVSMMLLAYSCLARVQHSAVLNGLLCTVLGYGIYFGFVAAFAWLNVMCFDIWWTFGSVRTVKPLRKSTSERRRFLWYSVYAWSVAVVLSGTMFLLDRYSNNLYLKANIGAGACWFGTIQNTQLDWPHYIFFVLPMGVVTCTNFILWLLTARYCAKVKSEVHRLQAGSVGDRAKKRFRIDRAKYILTGKLWVVMGAGWISELISTLVSEPLWLWNVIDLINELQGVLIFLILVMKPKVLYLIRKRLGLEKPPQNNAGSSSGRTSSTFLSRTISSDERANLRISLPQNNLK